MSNIDLFRTLMKQEKIMGCCEQYYQQILEKEKEKNMNDKHNE